MVTLSKSANLFKVAIATINITKAPSAYINCTFNHTISRQRFAYNELIINGMQLIVDENATIQHKYNKNRRLKKVLNDKFGTKFVRYSTI